ncbi:MAG: putative oxidoreductase C-terminal domain-containing protein [Bacteroidota bacterium]|nr:putative oxidoreductase C-terminal domain-containing protein [Bacteroidota bacterium]
MWKQGSKVGGENWLFFYPLLFYFIMPVISAGCQSPVAPKETEKTDSAKVRLVTLDPGHFHAALVQKSMSDGIDSNANVYAPEGPELRAHLDLIKQYNGRAEAPTHWVEKIYTGPDFLEKMISERKGNVIVMAGNNLRKTHYISKSVEAGLNVLADKPMAINVANFKELENDFSIAAQHKVLLYDIMTERSEITNLLQKELAQMPEVFGTLDSGSEKKPAVRIESVHYFYKFVSGKALTRPAWFFDPAQQGDAIADVGVHLIDLVQWACFPDAVIDYKKDIAIHDARIWPTPITLSQFAAVTKNDRFPSFLKPYLQRDTVLQTHGNGQINYTLKGVHIKLTARWEYKAPEGSGDTHYCLLRGSLANLEIKQGAGEDYKPTLYIIPLHDSKQYDDVLQKAVAKINTNYPGVAIERAGKTWRLVIPEKFKVGHEAHFAQVLQRYLRYLRTGQLPAWEVPDMIAKYYTATAALEMAGSNAK